MKKLNLLKDSIFILLYTILLCSCIHKAHHEDYDMGCTCDSTCEGKVLPMVEMFPDSIDMFGHIPYTVRIHEIELDNDILTNLDSLYFSKFKRYKDICKTKNAGLRFINMVFHQNSNNKDEYSVFCYLTSHLPETAVAGFLHNGYICFVYGAVPCRLAETGRMLIVSSNNPDYYILSDGADFSASYSKRTNQFTDDTISVDTQLQSSYEESNPEVFYDEKLCSIIDNNDSKVSAPCKCGQICVCACYPPLIDAPTEEDYKRIQPYTAIIDEIEIDKRNLIVLDSLFFNHVLELKKSAVDKIDEMKYVYLESEESKDSYSIQCSLSNLFNESESVGFMHNGLLVIVHGKIPFAKRLTGKKIKFDVLPPSTMIDEPLAFVEFLFDKKSNKYKNR